MPTHQETLQKIVTELIEKMGFVAAVSVKADGEALWCDVQVEKDQHLLIGQYGVNLAAIQHLVRVLMRKQTEDRFDVVVDINNYFSDKRELLKKEAEKAMEEALQNNISVALRPMLPYERKIIHSFLAEHPSVTTESIGAGEERKVLIRPRPTTSESEE